MNLLPNFSSFNWHINSKEPILTSLFISFAEVFMHLLLFPAKLKLEKQVSWNEAKAETWGSDLYLDFLY